jgi:hypothetical protein
MFLDSDDWIEPECVSLLYAERMRSGVDVVCGQSMMTDSGASSPVVGGYVERDRVELLLSFFNGRFPVTIWNKLYVVSQLRDCGVRCPHRIMEDNWFTFQLLLCIGSYAIIPEVTYHYTIRGDSITGVELYGDSITGVGWSESTASQWEVITVDLLGALDSASLDASLRILVRKKLFWLRVSISERVLVSGHDVSDHIKVYLSAVHLGNRDTLHSLFLLCAYIFCCMPMFMKRLLLRYHLRPK